MKNKKGFTLVEILAVLVILGILSTLIIVNVKDNKDSYNEELKNQLILSGKAYFTSNKEKLPISNGGKSYSYVTVPEMQSENYITNSFVDSEKRECSPSYVYVTQKTYGSNDYMYIPCLICQDKQGNKVSHHEENDPYCNVSDWNDNISPTCDYEDVGSSSLVNLKNVKDTTDAAVVKEKNIKAIVIKEKEKYYSYDVSNMTYEEIENLDIKEIFDDKIDKDKETSYDVYVVDKGGNEQVCSTFKVLANKCECQQVDDKRVGSVTTTFTTIDVESNTNLYYKEEGKEEVLVTDFIKNYPTINKTTEIPYKADIYVKNDKGETTKCLSNTYTEGYPNCRFTKVPSGFIGSGGTTLELTCTMDNENLKFNDKSKIEVTNGTTLGSIVTNNISPAVGTSKSNLVITIPYKPDSGKTGSVTITVKEGAVVSLTDETKKNESIKATFKVDTKAPVITYTVTSGTKSNATTITGDKGEGYQNSVTVKVECTDEGVGINKLVVAGKEQTSTTASVTYSTRSTNTLKAECSDKVTPANTVSKSQSYRVLKETADCTKCGIKTYVTKRSSACECETYKLKASNACSCKTKKSSCSKCGYNKKWYITYQEGSTDKHEWGSSCSTLGVKSYTCPTGYGPRCYAECSKKCKTCCTAYKSCRDVTHGCETFESCAHHTHGCATGKSCWY